VRQQIYHTDKVYSFLIHMQLHSEFKFNSVISFSFWGLRPQTPTRGSAPGPRWGTPVLQIPSAFGPPTLDDGLTPLQFWSTYLII